MFDKSAESIVGCWGGVCSVFNIGGGGKAHFLKLGLLITKYIFFVTVFILNIRGHNFSRLFKQFCKHFTLKL